MKGRFCIHHINSAGTIRSVLMTLMENVRNVRKKEQIPSREKFIDLQEVQIMYSERVHGPEQGGTLNEVTVTAQKPSLLEKGYYRGQAAAQDAWNSPMARASYPDKISLSFSSSVTAF